MRLKELLAGCGVIWLRGDAQTEIEVSGVSSDSRTVEPGSIFIAVSGWSCDGHSFIAKAVEAGATVVVYEDEAALGFQLHLLAEKGIPETAACFVQVDDSRRSLALIAANFYDNPSKKLSLVGITGTNGKTTTVTLLYNLFLRLGYNCGLLSTIANFVGTHRLETTNTTSDPITINRLLAEMVEAGCEYCFMEVSSIGLDQDRVWGLDFKVGIFSNLTHDHLDYHKTFAEYLRCKKLFFDRLPKKACAVINADDRNGAVMVQNTKAKVITYSCVRGADHTCRVMEQSLEGMLVRIDGKETWTRLVGEHNAYNLLATYCAALALGADQMETLVAISSLEAATGRLETIRGPRGLSAVIDYAHTPDALAKALKTLKSVAPGGHLTCVFGCGGDRDRSKRPEMAAAAEKWADRIIVTSDNSRTEKTEDILAEIRAGLSPAGIAKSLFIADRKEAIRTAVMLAPAGSTVLLAGKGHETYQVIGKEKLHFDEREILAEAFAQIGGN